MTIVLRYRWLSLVLAGLILPAAGARVLADAGTRVAPPPTTRQAVMPGEFKARRLAALAALGDGLLVLRGSVEEEFGEVGRFRQNNWFYYYTGVEVPGALLVLNPFAPEARRETLYLPGRNFISERWTGPQIGPGPEAQQLFGFEAVRDARSFEADVEAALKAAAEPPDRDDPKVYGVVPAGKYAEFSFDSGLVNQVQGVASRALGKPVRMLDARYELGELRRKKSPAELALIQKAIDITAEAQRDLARLAAPGRWEYELEAAIVSAFLRNGAPRAGFPSIVGSGINSTVLHYASNSKQIEEGDLIVVDIGAEYGFYSADITRTWPASGKFTARQREIYELVLEAQRAAERAYKPGMTMRDLNQVAILAIRNGPARDQSGATLEGYFIHGLGHFLGMDVHDVGAYEVALKPGDVITIEPGIYITAEKLGIRIEDDYLVTDTGLVKLSRALPSEPDDIERLMRRQ